MLQITHNLTSSIDLGNEVITIKEEMVDTGILHAVDFSRHEAVTRHYVTLVETKDKMIREALIRLGWTPPPEGRVLHSRREGSDPANLQGDNDATENKDAGSLG